MKITLALLVLAVAIQLHKVEAGKKQDKGKGGKDVCKKIAKVLKSCLKKGKQ